MKKKIVILGKGFLGKKFEQKGFEVWGKDKFELTPSCTSLFPLDEYDIIINCIGKSDTRWCEEKNNFQEALFSNGQVPKILSEYCATRNKRFVHISTGCLYDRNDVPQKETDFVAAHCDYTLTKWMGEKHCNLERDLILRPRLYFGDFAARNNLLSKLLKFDKFLTELNSYTSLNIVVDAVTVLLRENQSGIFNIASDGYATMKELSEWIGLKGEGITQSQLHWMEKLYLVNNIMDLSKLKRFFKPLRLKDEVLRCWKKLNEEK